MAGYLFLALSLVGLVLTAVVYRPVYHRPRRAVVTFFTGWLRGELAPHLLVVELTVTAIFVAFGALANSAGWAGLGLSALQWFALAHAWREGLGADRVIEAAMREGLGDDYRADIRPELAERLSERLDWRRVARPFTFRRPGVKRARGIVYARERGLNLRLDVYRPERDVEGAPVLLQIHGGGWVIGSKNEQGLVICNELASQGWVCVNADYRLSPHATFPEHLIDLKKAIGWIKTNIADFGGDPDFICVTGGSAGGHLAAMVGLTANDPEYQPGFEGIDTTVRACVPFYGIYDFADRHGAANRIGLDKLLERQIMKGSLDEIPDSYERASPIARVHPDAPPFMVVHGSRDSLASVADARHFVEVLRKTSRAPAVYAELPGAQHAFEIFHSPRALHSINGVARFLAWARSRYLDERR